MAEAEVITIQTLQDLRDKLLELCLEHKGNISGLAFGCTGGYLLEISSNSKPLCTITHNNFATMKAFLLDLTQIGFFSGSPDGSYFSLLPEYIIEWHIAEQ